jgi:general secretion pathway protein C
MKWLAKLGKIKPVPLASSAASVLLSGYLVTTGMAYLNATPLEAVDDTPRKADETKAPVDRAPPMSTLEVAQSILQRNIFDSNVGSIAWEDRPAVVEVPDDGTGEPGESPEATAPLADCKGDLRLLASVVTNDPSRSVAVIRRGSAPSTQVLVGTEVENVELLMLAPTHAYIRDNHAPTCRLPLFPSLLPPPAPPMPVATPAPVAELERRSKKPPLFTDADHAAGIHEIGPDTYKVTRDMITRGMADAAGVVRGTKFHPQTGAGGERNAGVKLQGVAEGSTLSKLGMRDGDTLRTLNGVNLSTPDGMLSAYQLLREQKKVTLSVMRDGRPKTLTYQFE